MNSVFEMVKIYSAPNAHGIYSDQKWEITSQDVDIAKFHVFSFVGTKLRCCLVTTNTFMVRTRPTNGIFVLSECCGTNSWFVVETFNISSPNHFLQTSTNNNMWFQQISTNWCMDHHPGQNKLFLQVTTVTGDLKDLGPVAVFSKSSPQPSNARCKWYAIANSKKDMELYGKFTDLNCFLGMDHPPRVS